MGDFSYPYKRLYYTFYNWTTFFGWARVLYIVLKTLMELGHEHVYSAVEKPLLVSQTAAVLEVLHGLVGMVRSPITATFPQIGSRIFLIWGILWSFPESRSHVLVSPLLISWSIAEISRFAFFGFKEAAGLTPSCLLWLRYSAFTILYPAGIFCEIGLIYVALPFIKESEKYCIRMPNKWNLSFNYFYSSIVILGMYIPGSPHMYRYMLARRRKVLSNSRKKE
ncbi:very-long-chain (3R)-3-hydroxyacyl-CoA dehydratase PASTICCINO 2A-like [Cicer arietinum]|uniref:Very-long-chain (3R)-3-hydroxyacyl-CoA dehydratase n=1 Tax=Cicer arietinum TaxID=3827 RepID=A0A1S2YTJ2_CICAR|nr:very-long-chain (3R)-3-hydroxyacyl-CoA dehydratase PASTICCINO 2A-like [Cicer arietinum]